MSKQSGPGAAQIRRAKPATAAPRDYRAELRRRVVGQEEAIHRIASYLAMNDAGLNPPGRPLGTFMLLGPTGSGKTWTVEALAEVLHGSPDWLVRIDCQEFQSDHEISKLVGAPPGYLGHRETAPLLTQSRLTTRTTRDSNVTIVLFDEIEKAGDSLRRLLLGVMDRAILTTGDNMVVNFERCLIFMTSNVGTGNSSAMRQDFGFRFGDEAADRKARTETCQNALRKEFTAEFRGRIDATVMYAPLGFIETQEILDTELGKLNRLLSSRLGDRAFQVNCRPEARDWLVREGFTKDSGARNLKRVMSQQVLQRLSHNLSAGLIQPGSIVDLGVVGGQLSFDPGRRS